MSARHRHILMLWRLFVMQKDDVQRKRCTHGRYQPRLLGHEANLRRITVAWRPHAKEPLIKCPVDDLFGEFWVDSHSHKRPVISAPCGMWRLPKVVTSRRST